MYKLHYFRVRLRKQTFQSAGGFIVHATFAAEVSLNKRGIDSACVETVCYYALCRHVQSTSAS